MGPSLGQESAVPSPEDQFRKALDGEKYDLAVKVAILYFRPDLHCEVFVERASQALRSAEKIIEGQEVAVQSDPEQLNQAAKQLAEVHAFGQQALGTAQDYVDAGWDAALRDQVRDRLDLELEGLEELAGRLEALRHRAKPFDVLMTQSEISAEDIKKLSLETKLVLGFYLADRGLFDRAIKECFQPVQVEGSPPLRTFVKVTTELLDKWHDQATYEGKWNNLVNSGLDAYDEMREQLPDQIHSAGWLLALVAHLARDHYDVPVSRIKETLTLLEQLSLPTPRENNERLLAAKLRHEQFLLRRRAGQWQVALPPDENLDLFSQTNDLWYTAEAALIAAAATDDQSAKQKLLQKSQTIIATIRVQNEPLARALQKRVDRYVATTKPFEDWLVMALSRDYQDQRGTVLPEVMAETRSELADRVRAGFESSIAHLLADGQNVAAFQEAQKAKALTVGRIVEPVSVAELIGSELLSKGIGGKMQIPRKELFIEYYFGPTRAWAFYVFAPGDVYEPLRVVELNRDQMISRCRQAINALRNGETVENPGTWLLSGSPALDELWVRRENFKKSPRSLRRMVIAPDGPLCYLPLHKPFISVASSIDYLPTAAVLKNSKFLDSRDVQLMWEAQRGDLSPVSPDNTQIRKKGHITLWPGVTMPILLKDTDK